MLAGKGRERVEGGTYRTADRAYDGGENAVFDVGVGPVDRHGAGKLVLARRTMAGVNTHGLDVGGWLA